MSEYVMRSDGPGSIGALVPGAALSHPPTIGSNDPRRNINPRSHGAYGIPSLAGMGLDYQVFPTVYCGGAPAGAGARGANAGMSGLGAQVEQAALFGSGCGCSNGMGTNGNGEGLPSWAAPVGILAVLVGGMWWLKRSKDRDEQASALARYGYGE
jgi:hypothetical protein